MSWLKENKSNQFTKFFCRLGPLLWVFLGLWLCYTIFTATKNQAHLYDYDYDYEETRSDQENLLTREKRLVYMDNDRRFRLPPKTSFTFSFIVQFPFWSNLPTGYVSGLTIAIPVTVGFDDLGWTSETNRFGYFDFYGVTTWDYSWMDIFGLRNFNWTSLDVFNLRDINMTAIDTAFRFPFRTMFNYLVSRSKRDVWEDIPGVNYAGGDRELVYQVLEDTMTNLGIDGQPCLLRFICEVHEEPLPNYGFFGEVLMMLSTPSLSPSAEYRLGPYVQAERNGKLKKCAKYRKVCPYTFFEFDTRYYRGGKGAQRLHSDESTNAINQTHQDGHREKRFIYFGPRRRILFPPTTVIVLTPSLSLPFARGLTKGFSSGLSISSPFTISFDDLKYTSSLNRFGHLPFLKRKRRDNEENLPDVAYVGGDRQLMYTVIEDNLLNLGFNGKACLLRAICELHQIPLLNHGLFGELFELLLTPSLSPFPGKNTAQYAAAENLGKHCGDCSIFEENCPTSLFTNFITENSFSSWEAQVECKRHHSQPFREGNMNHSSDKTDNNTRATSISSRTNLNSNHLLEERSIEFVKRVLGDSNS